MDTQRFAIFALPQRQGFRGDRIGDFRLVEILKPVFNKAHESRSTRSAWHAWTVSIA
jgi:hypothetical protein